MDIITSPTFRLIKNDLTKIRECIIYNNDIDNWSKIAIVYNIFIFFQMSYLAFTFSNNNPYYFLFSIVVIRSLYIQFILNILKIDKNIGISLFNLTKNFFI